LIHVILQGVKAGAWAGSKAALASTPNQPGFAGIWLFQECVACPMAIHPVDRRPEIEIC
jgi:hypothetical protein